jgi:hypothetical protein
MRARTIFIATIAALIAPSALAHERCAHALAAPTEADARRIAESIYAPMNVPPAPHPWPVYVEDKGDRWHVYQGARVAAAGPPPAQTGTGMWIAKCNGAISEITTIVNVPRG